MGVGAWIANVVTGAGNAIVQPVANVFAKKEERKQAHETAVSALSAAKQNDQTQITLANTDVEKILSANAASGWKDEYVTVSLIMIVNAVILGGILQGFGFPGFLTGVLIGVKALSDLIDLRDCMTAAVYAAIGFSIWKKV